MRHLLGRKRSGEQGPTPPWLPIHASLIPFVCGSLAGVSSWALIYPLDVVKTKIQQRALAGAPSRTVRETFHRLIRGKMTKLTSKKITCSFALFRSWSNKSKAYARWACKDLSWPWCECITERHYSWTAVDFLWYHLELYRQTTSSQRRWLVLGPHSLIGHRNSGNLHLTPYLRI